MTLDSRLFIKVHLGFPEHWKTEELSDKAFRHLVTAWCFCARNMTDGRLTFAQSRKLFTPKTVGELLKAPYMHKTATGYQMHEYVEHQMSAADVSDLREKRSAAGKRGGEAKARNLASASPVAKQTPSKPLAELEVDKELELTTTKAKDKAPSPRAASVPDRFDEFWSAYPRKVSRERAVRAWPKATKKASPDKIIAAAHGYGIDPNLPDLNYVPYPATWLNDGGWNNPPCAAPTTTNGKPSGGQLAQNTLNLQDPRTQQRPGYRLEIAR